MPMTDLIELQPASIDDDIIFSRVERDEPKYERTLQEKILHFNFSARTRTRKEVGSYVPLTIFTLAISSAGLMFGYDIGTIGALIHMPAFVEKFGDNLATIPRSFYPFTKGAIMGISSIGGFLGGVLTMILVPIMGPRLVIFTSGICSLVANVIIIISTYWVQVLMGRFLYGISCGMICVTCPMLISELAPVSKRGLFISLFQLNITVGIVTGAITMLLSNAEFGNSINNQWQFKYPLIQGIGICVISCLAVFIAPESPAWLIFRGSNHYELARTAIARSRNLKERDPIVTNHFNELIALINTEDDGRDEINDSLIKGEPKYLLRTVTGCLISFFQQMTGINYFFFFGTAIFQTIGVGNPYLVSIFFGCVNLIFSLISVPVISRFNRRTLLLLGSTILTITMLIFCTVGLFTSYTTAGSTVMIISSCIFIGIFATTWGPLVSIVVSEIYPPNIKVKAMAVCGCTGWISTFLVSFSILPLTALMGFGLGYIFSGFTIVGGILIYLILPETRQVDIPTLDAIYESEQYLHTK